MIRSEFQLIADLSRDRAAGKRIGFVSVSFELLRVADVRLLQKAASQSDRLVVAVVDDESPRVVSAADRAELVDGLRGVNYVIVCRADRVEPLAALLRPDVRS